MSRTILTALSFHKDFNGIDYSYYSSNVYPKTPSKSTLKKTEEESTEKFIQVLVKDTLQGSLELPKTHKLSYYIDILSKDIYDPFIYDTEYKGKWERKENAILWTCKEAEKLFDEQRKRYEEMTFKIARSFISDSLKNEIKKLKEQKFVLFDGRNYITKLTTKGYYYSCIFENAKVFNGFEIKRVSQYIKDKFEIKEV